MLYFTIILIGLYYLILKSVGICYYIDHYYINYYLFEQSNDDEFNIELDDDYFDNYLSDDENKYYYGHYVFLNKIDEKLTKYFSIN